MDTKEEILKKHCNGLPEPRYTQFILPAMQEYADQQNKYQSELIEALAGALERTLPMAQNDLDSCYTRRGEMVIKLGAVALTLYKEYKNKQDGKTK